MRKHGTLINVTPLLDVLLVLLVVLLVAVGIPLRSVPVDAPPVGAGFAASNGSALTVFLQADGTLAKADGTSLAPDAPELQGQIVELVAARSATFETIAKAVDRLAAGRPREIRLAGRG